VTESTSWLKAVPRAAVHLPEGNPFRGGCRGIQRDRAGHERKLEEAIPVSTRHRRLQRKHEDAPNLGGDSKESTEHPRQAPGGARSPWVLPFQKAPYPAGSAGVERTRASSASALGRRRPAPFKLPLRSPHRDAVQVAAQLHCGLCFGPQPPGLQAIGAGQPHCLCRGQARSLAPQMSSSITSSYR